MQAPFGTCTKKQEKCNNAYIYNKKEEKKKVTEFP